MNDATTDRGHFTLELSGVPAIGNERSVDRGHFTLELSGVPDACNLKAKEHQSQAARRIVDEVGTHNTNIENYDEYILVERLFIFDIIFTYNYIQNVYLS